MCSPANHRFHCIEYTINQIDEYRACGVDGIHLYALNKYDDVAYIAKAAGLIDLV